MLDKDSSMSADSDEDDEDDDDDDDEDEADDAEEEGEEEERSHGQLISSSVQSSGFSAIKRIANVVI